MRRAKVLFKDEEAGTLVQHDNGSFTFSYDEAWLENLSKPAISLTLPKTSHQYYSAFLFSFFYNMLPEGANKLVACTLNRIDQKDDFGLLASTAKFDSIGAIRILKISE